MKKNKNLILAAGSRCGIYMIQTFLESFKENLIDKEKFENVVNFLLQDPDSEGYFEAVDSFLMAAKFLINGDVYYLLFNEDLWLVKEGYKLPNNFLI